MPCSDGGPSQAQIKAEARDREQQIKETQNIEAFLCAICTVLDTPSGKGTSQLGKTRIGKNTFDTVLDLVDWEEAGVTRTELLAWWAGHKKQDELRLRYEKEQLDAARATSEREALRKKALSKLTPEERAVIMESSIKEEQPPISRWFRVRGRYTNITSSQGIRTLILQVMVPNTGSYQEMVRAAREQIRVKHSFAVHTILSHSTDRDCL